MPSRLNRARTGGRQHRFRPIEPSPPKTCLPPLICHPEVTNVTIQNRYLMRPSDELNEIVLGVFGKAQALYGMTIISLTVLSSHFHLLAVPRDAEHLADFMEHVNCNLSKEIARIHDWSGSLWQRRYKLVVISDEEEAQVARLKYVLSNGVKENLVRKAADWPGVHSVDALTQGEPLVGKWYSRRQEYAARQLRGENDVSPEDYVTEYEVKLSPLPCWRDQYDDDKIRQEVLKLVEEIEQEGAAERRRTGKKILGARKIRGMDPHYRPKDVKKSPKPRFHAKTREAFKLLREAYREILATHREASERLRSGDRFAEFPDGTFPPALPFVPFVDGIVARGQPV